MSSRPTWDELRARDAENRALAAATPHAAMIRLYGHHRDAKTCANCVNLVDRHDEGQVAGHYFKCALWIRLNPGVPLGGPRTDWRKRFDACGKFEPRPVVASPAKRRTKESTPGFDARDWVEKPYSAPTKTEVTT